MFHPYRKFAGWRRVLQNFTNTLNFNLFSFLSAWIFVILGQLLIIHLSSLATALKSMTEDGQKIDCHFLEITRVVRHFRQLNRAARLLSERFTFILTAVCCASFVSTMNLSYFLIQFAMKKHIIWPLWDLLQVVDNTLRIFFICRTADRIRQSVSLTNYNLSRLIKEQVLKRIIAGNQMYTVSSTTSRCSSQANSIGTTVKSSKYINSLLEKKMQ